MIVIRFERPEDISSIHYVNEQAFGRQEEAELIDVLRRNDKITLSLVAVEDNQIIGHILFSPVVIEAENTVYKALGLGPIAVLPACQRKGIGSSLVEAGLEECRKAGHEAVIVIGHPEFYPRFGFSSAKSFGICYECAVPDEAFMALELVKGALDGKAGTARYLPEFDGV